MTSHPNHLQDSGAGHPDLMIYFVLVRYKSGLAWAERDPANMSRRDTIADIMTGDLENVVTVLECNPVEHVCSDVTEDILAEAGVVVEIEAPSKTCDPRTSRHLFRPPDLSGLLCDASGHSRSGCCDMECGVMCSGYSIGWGLPPLNCNLCGGRVLREACERHYREPGFIALRDKYLAMFVIRAGETK